MIYESFRQSVERSSSQQLSGRKKRVLYLVAMHVRKNILTQYGSNVNKYSQCLWGWPFSITRGENRTRQQFKNTSNPDSQSIFCQRSGSPRYLGQIFDDHIL